MDIRANILIDAIALCIALAALGNGRSWRQREGVYPKRFRSLLVSISLILAMDMITWLCDGRTFFGARVCCYVTNTGCYVLQIMFCWLWAMFVFDWTRGFRKRSPREQLIFALPLLGELAVLACNPFTGGAFSIDDANRYVRGNGYLLNLIPFAMYTLFSLVILLRAWIASADADRKRHSVPLLVGMLLPSCGCLIETRNYGLMLTWPLTALSLLLIYLSAQQEQSALDRAELTESRMAIMLSQIQPHFLYNSLTVIAELCETDPEKARYATMQFSAFLRGNMSSLTINKPIAFEHELQHTKNYLALEQLRFQARLRTAFQIETTMFQLPTLTLQPIVENAVRYGVTKRPEGGVVTIRTQETSSDFVITVSDDGMGFDPEASKDDGRTHIGISNVRDRLARMVNGTLEITSTPNVGTVAVITIPKGAYPC